MNEINEDANDLIHCTFILYDAFSITSQKAENALKTFNKKYWVCD